MSLPLIRYVLTAALRDRLIVTLLAAMLVCVSLSVFLGSAAVSEKNGFALVFAGGSVRLAGVLGLVLFVVFFMRRSFEARDVEFLLARPVGRAGFIFSYAAAFSIIALFMSLGQALCLYMLEFRSFGEAHLLWALSLAVENIVMANVALFFSMILSSAASAAMAAAGFYVLARMLGQILGIMAAEPLHGLHVMRILEYVMQGISALMPRLDLMAQSSWLVYGVENGADMAWVLAQAFVFIVLVVLAAMIDLVRRQF